MPIYLGLFVIAFATLSLEITLVRLLSVTTWYHLSFFAISLGMLGMTAGARRVYLQRRSFEGEAFYGSVTKACLRYAMSVPVCLALLCVLPVDMCGTTLRYPALLATTLICAVPFYYSGVVVSAVLTKRDLPMGRLYASDLFGASLGCLFVLFGLDVMDAPSLILLCAALGALGAWLFCLATERRPLRLASVLLMLLLTSGGILNSYFHCIRPVVVKGRGIELGNHYAFDRWNSFSRVAVYPERLAPPQCWAASPLAPMTPVPQRLLNIDGEAATTMRSFQSPQQIEHLRYDLPNLAYWLGRKGNACIIGVGGGRDVQSALLFKLQHVTGIELNPIFIDLLKKDFRDFAHVADRPDVTLVADEARSYLSTHPERYSMIQMSLIDTWAATGAGAFSLSENCLYTVESWGIFFDRLKDDGLFTVCRWNDPATLETARLLSLAVATLQNRGVKDPSRQLAVATNGELATLVVSRQPLTREDVQKLTDTCKKLSFRLLLAPGQLPKEELYRKIVLARTAPQLAAAVQTANMNLSPTTDESPYFFNMLRLGNIASTYRKASFGVLHGNLAATLTLVSLMATLLVVALATVIVPLFLRPSLGLGRGLPFRVIGPGMLYFSLIGAGFMLTEIALIQRLTVVLSHPIYALGILLFALIASTGVGSYLSDRLPLTRKPWLFVYPIMAAVSILGLRFLLSAVCPHLIVSPLATRIAACIAMIFPLGVVLGLCFPTGMRLAKELSAADTPWYWALNGVFGVLCSALAVFISIYLGVSINFYLAAGCYLTVSLAQVWFLAAQSHQTAALASPSGAVFSDEEEQDVCGNLEQPVTEGLVEV